MSERQQVYTSDGHRGVIVGAADPSRDEPRFVEVQMEDGARLHVPAELLELRPDGAFTLQVGAADLAALAGDAEHQRLVLPVVVEELEVGRRTLTTGVVRVQKHVREREQLVEEPVTREEVHVERVPVGHLVDVPPPMRSEGATLVIPVLEEVLVIEKRLRLKEEVRVTWSRIVEQSAAQVVLRDEEVVVDRLAPDSGHDPVGRAAS